MIRLINVQSLELESFDRQPPRYAILSHRWNKDEIDHNDINNAQATSHKPGWEKLKRFCELAQSLGYSHAWLDTCCIDKASTAELSRSIRSMYQWYAQSDTCIAYLGDIARGQHDFQCSKWFERGWTLQELIAPDRVDFYDSQWTLLGSRTDLMAAISERTRIPPAVLGKRLDIQECSVAQRMSWAAGRDTTEPEDRAYSLVGLFNVSCVVQYGEGEENAFLSLQKEIIKEYSDESIFAWRWPENIMQDSTDNLEYHGMLASSPDWFEACGNLFPLQHASRFAYANGTLSIKLPTRPHSLESYLGLLNVANGHEAGRVTLILARLSIEGEYVRVRDHDTRMTETKTKAYETREIAVRQRVTEIPSKLFQGYWLRRLDQPTGQEGTPKTSSKGICAVEDRIKLSPEGYGTAGVVRMLPHERANGHIGWPQICWLKFGFDDAFNPVCMVANPLIYRHSHVALNHDLFDQSLQSSSDAGARDSARIFQEHWLPSNDQVIRKEETWRQGFVVLKGNRKQGLHVVIKDIGLVVTITKCENKHPASTADDSGPRGGMVWTVDVQNTAITERSITSAIGLCSFWTCTCLLDLLTCTCFDHNSNLAALDEQEASGPPITYHQGHPAWI